MNSRAAIQTFRCQNSGFFVWLQFIKPDMTEKRKGVTKMKKFTLLSLLILISATLLTFTNAFGADSFKYSESYKQKVLCSSYYGYCDVFDFGKYNISAKLSLAGKDIDLSKINGNTPFYMEVGDFYVYFLLKDGQYIPGKTSKSTSKTSVVLSDYDWVTENEHAQYMWIKLSWNSKAIDHKNKGIDRSARHYVPDHII